MKQNIRIVFTHSGKHLWFTLFPTNVNGSIVFRECDELSIKLASSCITSSIGRFEFEDTHLEKWYSGTVVDYNPVSKLRTIKYDGEEDHCQFDITVDYIVGDLVVIDN